MKKVKQGYLKGMKPPRILAIDTAANEYAELRDRRMDLLEREIKANNSLLALMKEHCLSTYQYDDDGVMRVVSITNMERVKVKRAKEDGDDEE